MTVRSLNSVRSDYFFFKVIFGKEMSASFLVSRKQGTNLKENIDTFYKKFETSRYNSGLK